MSRRKRDEVLVEDAALEDNVRMVSCRLHADEREVIAKNMAQLIEAQQTAEQEKAAMLADWNAKKKARLELIRSCGKKIREGAELRAVRVKEERLYDEGVVIVRRADNDEVLESRPMSIEERQKELNLS